MLTQDLTSIFFWWLTIFLLGLITLPATANIFDTYFDTGYVFSKTLSILFLSYISWLLGSLKILPFIREELFLILFIISIVNIFVYIKHSTYLKTLLKNKVELFIFEEVLFTCTLTSWALVRGFLPDIRSLEKFMDYGFVNSIISSTYLPPIDMWQAGEHINYYYFGHLISATLFKLTGIAPGVAYNLMIATLFALTFTSVFSLVANLLYKKFSNINISLLGGIIGSLLVTLGGNFHTLYMAFKNTTAGNSFFLNYWYPDATRFIVQNFGAKDNTIHEFPIYSFVVADLHGHLINLPFVILILALISKIIINRKLLKIDFLFLSLLFGIFYMTNSWDLPVYALVLGLSLVYIYFLKFKLNLKTLLVPAILGLSILAGSFILTLPFQLTFESISKGLAFSDYNTPLWMIPVLWGGPIIITLLFFISFIKKQKLENEEVFIGILILVSWFLIIVPEIFYVKDIYIDSYQRANTMFKFTYQSFVMFAVSTSYLLIKLTYEKFNSLKTTFKFLVIIPVISYLTIIMIYPYFAIKDYYDLKSYKGLNGEYWLFKEYPGEYRALQWIRNNVTKKSVILSAPGDSYSDSNVLQAYTGMPTIQGWFVHEWLWRGNSEEPAKRSNEVETIYTSDNPILTKELLKKYKVEYVVIGKLEKSKYINLSIEKFVTLGQLVFSADGTDIYKLY